MTKAQLEYLKTWVVRTRSDVAAAKDNIKTYPDNAVLSCTDVENNLNELEKWLEAFKSAPPKVSNVGGSNDPS